MSEKTYAYLSKGLIIFCCVGVFFMSSCSSSKQNYVQDNLDSDVETKIPVDSSSQAMTNEDIRVDADASMISGLGTAQSIPYEIQQVMQGISIPDGASVEFDELSYLTIPYFDFNGNVQNGHMVVAKELSQDVLEIFAELYAIKYPIESMELIDYFNDKQTDVLDSLDRASMGNDNTSAFCYRVVSGTQRLSNHALGRAIDINPKINPYVTASGYVSPRNAEKYTDRSETFSEVETRAMIHSGDEVYNIFISHGWEWGGEIWSDSYYDYQHFQKP